jgi:excisionase family DNA binding protein
LLPVTAGRVLRISWSGQSYQEIISMAEPLKQPARPLPLDDPIYRPRVIGERTGKHAETIRKAIRAGELRGVRLGSRSIGVRASEVQRWLDALAAGGSAAPKGPKRRAQQSDGEAA